MIRRCLPILAVLLAGASLSGCAGMVIGGAASAGVAAAEERGLGGAVDDTKIRTEINNLWFQKDIDMYRKVTLNIQEGRVMLTGTVPKPEFKSEAERLSWQAGGVREVNNEVLVMDSGAIDYGRDVWIANTLRTRLMFDSDVKNINYNIDVVMGIVFLQGIAATDAERSRVIAHARDISNVKKVVSHIILRDDPRRFRS